MQRRFICQEEVCCGASLRARQNHASRAHIDRKGGAREHPSDKRDMDLTDMCTVMLHKKCVNFDFMVTLVFFCVLLFG